VNVTVVVARALERFAGGGRRVAVAVDGPPPATVAAVLEAVIASYPGLRDRVCDEQGQVRPHVNLFVDAESVRFTGGLKTPVNDGSELSILPAVSGG